MSDKAPLRGARVKAVRCPVEGHGYGSCGIAMSGEPRSRAAERRDWARDAAEALYDIEIEEQERIEAEAEANRMMHEIEVELAEEKRRNPNWPNPAPSPYGTAFVTESGEAWDDPGTGAVRLGRVAEV